MLEKNLWAQLRPRLKEKGFLFERIENSVAVGMSDLFLITPAYIPVWVEMKVSKRKVKNLKPETLVKIDWRPGQQRWGVSLTSYKQRAYTLVRFSDAFGIIKMGIIRVDGKVPISDILLLDTIEEVVEWINKIQ